ncbi:hypothetical protein PG984_006512 [Apiospora sp. TS-2023a]
MNEFNAFRFKYISPGRTALAVVAFYPGLCYATQRLYRWADGAYERQVHMSRKANRNKLRNNPHLTAEQKEAMPKMVREINFMNPKFAPFVIAMLPLNLRAKYLDRSLATCYQVWSPRTEVGAGMFRNLRQAITSTPLIGTLTILGLGTLIKYKNEEDKHQERTL